MATTYTPNYHLGKQEDRSDKFLMSVITDNMDIIDEQLKATDDKATAAAAGLRYKGAVNYYSNLPNNAEIGDAYTVLYAGSSGSVADGTEYVWGELNGTAQWIDFSKDAYTKAEVNALLTAKQDVIADLSDIRTGAGKGATAVQPGDIGTAAKKDVPVSGNASTSQVVMGNDSRLSDSRTPTAHNQAANTINAMTGYSKPSSTSAIGTGDTLNAAIGKLEKKADDNQSNISLLETSQGRKNLVNVADSTSTKWIEKEFVLPAGNYALYFGSLTSNATGTTNQVVFMDGGNILDESYCYPARGTDTSTTFTLNSACTKIRIYAGADYAGSQDKTVSFTNMMICDKKYYDSNMMDYQPYAMTNAEITAWILAQS